MSNQIDHSRIRASLIAVATTLGIVAAGGAQAQLVGPTYPAPGGTSFSSNSIGFQNTGSSATRIGTYSGFNTSAYGQLYFGESSNTSIGVSMNAGNTITGAEWMTPDYMSGNWVELHGTTSVLDGINSSSYLVNTYLELKLYNSANTPINFVTGSSVGLSGVDFVADVTAAAASGGFHYTAQMYACPVNMYCDSVSNMFSNEHGDGGGTLAQTSVSTGFFSTSPVPEPESYAMLLAGLGLMGFMARRRKQKETA